MTVIFSSNTHLLLQFSVQFFMDECLQRLIDMIDSGIDLKDLILSARVAKLVKIRLEMQAPYLSKWPQALTIQVCVTFPYLSDKFICMT